MTSKRTPRIAPRPPTGPGPASPARPSDILEAAGAVSLLALFLALQAWSFHPTLSDDWIYAYLARRWSEGAWPYRDFFFAHPPLHLLFLAPFLALFGAKIAVVRLLAGTAAAGAGFCLWRVARRLGGRGAGLLALAAFLFTYDVLRSSTHITGVNLALLLLNAGAWAQLKGRNLVAGACLAGATLAGLYTLPISAALLSLHLARRAPGWRRALTGFLVVFAGVQLLAALPAPRAYWREVYQYHGMKKSNARRTEESWSHAFAYSAVGCEAVPLLVTGLAGLALVRSRRRGRTGGPSKHPGTGVPAAAPWVALLGLIALQGFFLLSLREVYTYYLVPLYALLAVAFGGGASVTVSAARELWSGPGRKPLLLWLSAGVLLLALINVARPHEAAGDPVTPADRFTWRAAPLPPLVNTVVHDLFWKDERRAGGHYCPITRYLWHEWDTIDGLEVMVDTLRAQARPGDRIAGDSSLAPLLAMLAPMRILDDEADTNTKRFSSGLQSLPEFLNRIDRDDLVWLALTENHTLDSDPGFHRWRQARFREVVRAGQPDGEILLLLHRQDTARP